MLKIGIIGCGKITQVRHAPEYQENGNCELVAFYDNITERAEALVKEYGGKLCHSVDEVLDSGIDAVSVCVANAFHADVTIRALNKGIHVLCEKPMASTVEECEAMVSAAKANGKQLMIDQSQRFAKAHVKAHELIQSGAIGDIITFRTTFGHPGPEGWTGEANSWFFDKKIASFGAMADLGIHKTDLIHYLLDDDIVQVIARIATLDKKYPDGTPVSVDDNAYCIYQTRKGVLGTMHVSWTFYGNEDNSTVIYGTKGVLYCYKDPDYSLIWEKRDGGVERFALDQMTSNKAQTTGGRTNTGVIDAFVSALLTNQPVPISGEDASKSMRVVLAANTSSETNTAVQVNY